MPAPVAVAYALLIVLPTIKLIAAVISRRSWRRIRALQADLERDPALTDADRKFVRGRVDEAFGHSALMLLPFAVPIAMPIAAILCAFTTSDVVDGPETDRLSRELDAQRDRLDEMMSRSDPNFVPVSRWLHSDARLAELSNLSFPLAFLHYPLSALATLAMLVLTGWMPMMTLGVHYGSRYLFRVLRDVARTNTLTPLFSPRELFEA